MTEEMTGELRARFSVSHAFDFSRASSECWRRKIGATKGDRSRRLGGHSGARQKAETERKPSRLRGQEVRLPRLIQRTQVLARRKRRASPRGFQERAHGGV